MPDPEQQPTQKIVPPVSKVDPANFTNIFEGSRSANDVVRLSEVVREPKE